MILERAQHGRVGGPHPQPARGGQLAQPRADQGALGHPQGDRGRASSTQVVVLTAAGEKIFCAGMDLKAFADRA